MFMLSYVRMLCIWFDYVSRRLVFDIYDVLVSIVMGWPCSFVVHTFYLIVKCSMLDCW